MNTLIFVIIIITNLLLTPSVVPLTTGEKIALNDMYNEWNKTLKWTLPVSNACVNWTGIICNNGSIIEMFVYKLLLYYY